MYKILIIGHGGFSKGMKEALELILGKQKNVDNFILDEKHDHDMLEESIKKYIEENEHVIMFADFTGGAPHKIGARAIAELKKKTQFIVSGAPLAFLVQTTLMLPSPETKPEEVKATLEKSLKDAFDVAKVMSF